MAITVRIRKQLSDFSLQINFSESSKRIGILGASGSGKSMTLKMIAGIEQPDEGKIILDDHILYDSQGKINLVPQNRHIGYLFQNYALFPRMTVSENIAAGIHGRKSEKAAVVQQMIGKFHLAGLEQRFPDQLSGGQQQRVALARIMAYQPAAILLDEPFSALDICLRERMQEELFELLEDYSGAVIMVSHSRNEIYQFSDRLLIIDQGSVAAYGDTHEVFSHPGNRSAAMQVGCRNLSFARRLDDHHLYAENWGISLKTSRILPAVFSSIGYQASQWIPVWGPGRGNCIHFCLLGMTEYPFERCYRLKSAKVRCSKEDCLIWTVGRNDWLELDRRGMPDFLELQENEILFLQDTN